MTLSTWRRATVSPSSKSDEEAGPVPVEHVAPGREADGHVLPRLAPDLRHDVEGVTCSLKRAVDVVEVPLPMPAVVEAPPRLQVPAHHPCRDRLNRVGVIDVWRELGDGLCPELLLRRLTFGREVVP